MLAGSIIRELYLPVITRYRFPDHNNFWILFQILGESQCTRSSPT